MTHCGINAFFIIIPNSTDLRELEDTKRALQTGTAHEENTVDKKIQAEIEKFI